MNDTKNQYSEQLYKKCTFQFTPEERLRLTSLDTTAQTGDLARIMMNNIINAVCLPRVQIKNTPEVKVEFDLSNGNFYVYVPRKRATQEETQTEKKPSVE